MGVDGTVKKKKETSTDGGIQMCTKLGHAGLKSFCQVSAKI